MRLTRLIAHHPSQNVLAASIAEGVKRFVYTRYAQASLCS
jgi:hypothetical protein